MTNEMITFEQPLNEHIRVCLRLEHLFGKINHHLKSDNIWELRAALSTLLHILDVVDRPDIKSKLTNALRAHETALQHLERSPNIDRTKLHSILDRLEDARELLHNTQGKLGQNLRENEFLTTIRQRLSTPGGISDYAVPTLQLWLTHDPEELRAQLREWLSSFDEIKEMINLILVLTRESAVTQTRIANHGFYQESLAADVPYQMMRVAIAKSHKLFPEISVGRHRLAIHLFSLGQERPVQSNKDIEFLLTCCKI